MRDMQNSASRNEWKIRFFYRSLFSDFQILFCNVHRVRCWGIVHALLKLEIYHKSNEILSGYFHFLRLLTETFWHSGSTIIIDATDIAKVCSTIEMLNTSFIRDGRSTIPENIGTTPPSISWFALIPSIAHCATLVADVPFFMTSCSHFTIGHFAISLNSSTSWFFIVKGITYKVKRWLKLKLKQ